jgi:iron(III) transport system ATP-binding protein
MILAERLAKTFASKSEKVAAVQDVSFEAKAGELVTLLGPSGCGKTTTLRLIAGLERPDGGRVSIAGRAVVDIGAGLFEPPHRRNLGMVFQSYAIWPHMTVFDNVAYALEGKRLAREEVRRRATAALATVHLEGFADRPAPRLSGGQQQRVAIARALAGEPQALLFDEPLSNLDAKLRGEMRGEIKRLQRRIGVTSLYVTHDQAEALAISDWIMVMRDGRIIERGRPEDIYRRPRAVFTAKFIGDANLVVGRVVEADRATGRAAVDTAVGRLIGIDTNGTLAPGDAAMVSIRPEDVTPLSDSRPSGGSNLLKGIVTEATFAGAAVETEVRVGDTPLRWLARRGATARPGDAVDLAVDCEAAVVLPAERT